jgi:Spy/CpxP family protein refolding chaperone
MPGLPLEALNLTQAQQDLIRDIRERGREQGQQLEAKLREAQAAQQRAVSAIPVNEAAIRSATLALAELQADAAIQQARVQSEIFAALTPAQQEQARQAIAAREQRPQRGARPQKAQ